MQSSAYAPTPMPAGHAPAATEFLDRFYMTHRSEFLKWAYKYYNLLPDEAIDIYQDSVVILHENHERGKLTELRSTVKTYFYGIAKNLIFVYLKKRSRYRACHTCFSDMAESHETFFSTGYDDQEAEETLDVVGTALGRLSLKGQSIINLYYFERKSLREITSLLGYSSEDVVKTTKLRYKRMLKQLVQEEMVRRETA